MKLRIPYGQGFQEVSLPDASVLAITEPFTPSVTREPQAIWQEALQHPCQSPPLKTFLSGAGHLLVLVNDATRPTPTAEVLGMLQSPLEDWLRTDPSRKLTILVATGTHRPPTENEYHHLLGKACAHWRKRIRAHDCRQETEMIFLGISRFGNPMRIHRLAREADRILVIGSVEPHYFAGWTGGRKAIVPGIANFSTIERNHRHALDPAAAPLALAGNPLHEELDEALDLLGPEKIFSLQAVQDSAHRVVAAAVGHIRASFEAAVQEATRIYAVPVPGPAEIVVTVAPHPMDIDLYQSHKALEHGKLALRRGGIILLVSECREGVGPDHFVAELASAPTPEAVLGRLSGTYRLGYHKAGKIAELARHSRIWTVTRLDPDIPRKIFMTPQFSVQSALDAALAELGPRARVLFLLSGSVTVPLLPSS